MPLFFKVQCCQIEVPIETFHKLHQALSLGARTICLLCYSFILDHLTHCARLLTPLLLCQTNHMLRRSIQGGVGPVVTHGRQGTCTIFLCRRAARIYSVISVLSVVSYSTRQHSQTHTHYRCEVSVGTCRICAYSSY